VDFYATAATAFPVLFLAIAWDSEYFKRLGQRSLADDTTKKIWKLGVIRWFGFALCTWNILSLCIALVVLARLVPDCIVLRIIVLVGLVVSAATLLYRIGVDLRSATSGENKA
jgi:hypothetical protein